MNPGYAAAMIAVVAACTALTRWAPFLLFGGKRAMPRRVVFLGRVLPPAIIAALVVYCLKDVAFDSFANGPAALVSAALVAALHLIKRNTLVSIFVGTVAYMVLIRVF